MFNLSFTCFTGQRMEIDITHEPESEKTALSSVNMNKAPWASIFGCLLLLILPIVAFIYFTDRPYRSQQTSAPVTATIASPATSYRSSPTGSNEMSPRTPQPFVDYVRRTIDETPYYKREGRRVNPQKTY